MVDTYGPAADIASTERQHCEVAVTPETGRFVRATGVLSRSFGSEVLLASPVRDDFDALSGTGSLIWDLLEIPRTISSITAILEDIFDSPDGVVTADVEVLVRRLLERDLIREVTHD